MEGKIEKLRKLMESFSPEEKDIVLEILALALEITHPSKLE